ncbi:MAG: HEAT repeat domain-containing protein, partial [Candidatus Aminicenantales bacterium]
DSMGRSSDLYAMHLFDLIEKGKLTPELRRLIAAKSREATLASVKPILDEDTSHIFVPDQEEVDEESLKKEIKEIFQLDVYQDVMKGYAESLLAAKDKDTELARTELAKGLGFLDPSSPLTEKLEELVEDPSPEVCRYAAESMGRLRRREFVPALVRMLQDPKIRGDAVEALEKYGDKITGTLADYLGDAGQDPEVRSALASLLARICSPETAHILIRQLEEDRTPRDSELIDALDKIRAEKPDLRISVPVVKRTLRRKIQEYSSLFLEFTKAESQGGKEAFCIRFSEKCRQSLAEIFKLLGLIYPHEDITRAFQNLEGGTKESVAYAVELLDNILDKELRDALIPVVEDRPREEKIRACLALKKKVPEF